MKLLPLMTTLTLTALICGCAGVSTVERERLTAVESREEYIKAHPESRHVEQIRNGEIVRGMGGDEVIASWGMPNVYLVSKDGLEEYWIYYVQDPVHNSVMVYSLCFDTDNTLADWEIDMKRFSNYSLGYLETSSQERPGKKISLDKQ